MYALRNLLYQPELGMPFWTIPKRFEMLPKSHRWQMEIMWTILAVVLSQTALTTCTGASPCNACKNCKYSKHCAKDGGTCGLCKSPA
jgi:hypothetical protein